MSNIERDPGENALCVGTAPADTVPAHEVLLPREVPLGGPRAMLVRRTLPHHNRRMVGAWCFVDAYGPTHFGGQPSTRVMRVPPHPHIGLQTVTWLFDGEILHRDSLGSTQLIRAGELNLMTAGHGITHAEDSTGDQPVLLNGLQLWVALPQSHRDIEPHFEHHADLPVCSDADGRVVVVMGELAGAVSPARAYSPLLAAEITIAGGGSIRLPLEPDFEHAVLAVTEGITADGRPLQADTLVYLGCGRRELVLDAATSARAVLLGGTPFAEQLVMWWNFLGRSHDEIVKARTDWEAERAGSQPGARFGDVPGYAGAPLAAPPLPNATLRPRGRVRDVAGT